MTGALVGVTLEEREGGRKGKKEGGRAEGKGLRHGVGGRGHGRTRGWEKRKEGSGEGRGGEEAYLSSLVHGLEVREVHLDEGHEAEGHAETREEGIPVQMPAREGGREGGMTRRNRYKSR